MKFMWITALGAVVALASSEPLNAQAPPQEVWTDIQPLVDQGVIEGASHLVVQNGQVVRSRVAGWSDVDRKTPFKQDTMVRIYSMSKPITSVAAMILWEQGKFQLDDPVSKFIPAFADMKVIDKSTGQVQLVAPQRPLTIRDLFRHTSGFSYGDEPEVSQYYQQEQLKYRGPAGMFVPEMTIAQAAESLARIPALHHPGERFTYGFSTDLLGRLIEIWSGQTLDKYLQESLLGPLEMVDTGFIVPQEKWGRFASCHARFENRLIVIDAAPDSPYRTGFPFLSGGGGLVSSQTDYAHFCEMLISNGSFRGKQILKPETLDLMFEDQLNGIAGSFRFGLGFAIGDVEIGGQGKQRTATQYSWGGYASTDFRIVPSERIYQIFLRQFVPSAHELGTQQIEQAYQSLP